MSQGLTELSFIESKETKFRGTFFLLQGNGREMNVQTGCWLMLNLLSKDYITNREDFFITGASGDTPRAISGSQGAMLGTQVLG